MFHFKDDVTVILLLCVSFLHLIIKVKVYLDKKSRAVIADTSSKGTFERIVSQDGVPVPQYQSWTN
jgi:hypothetical protein